MGGPALALVGFGRFARDYYIPALRALVPDARLAIADPLPDASAAAARLWPGSHLEGDFRVLLDRAPLDAVLVASPPSTHLAVWRRAAGHGLPVFMEKPFLAPGELDLIDPADPAWRRLMIDFPRRFWPGYRDLGARVAGGEFGRAVRAELTLHLDLAPWLKVSRHRLAPGEGGALFDLGSQALDMAAMIFRERPSEIRARRDAAGAADRVALELGYDSGLTVTCDLAYGTRNRESVVIEGARGALRRADPNTLTWGPAAGPPAALRWGVDAAALCYRGLRRDRSMLRYSVRAALAAFLDGATKGARFDPGIEDALRVARWTEAAARSLSEGTAVALDEPPRAA